MKEVKLLTILSIALAISLVFLIYFVLLAVHFSFLNAVANMNIYSKASLYDSQLHDLLQEHAFLLIDVAHRAMNLSNSLNDSINALQININEIAALIGTIYGPDKANQFIYLWTTKINSYIDYVTRLGKNDPSANSTFYTNIAQYEEMSSTFWSSINPYINKTTIKQQIVTHVNNIKSAIDYWAVGDYPDYFVKLHDTYTEIGVYADYIANAIIQQHPEMFQ